MGNNFFIFKTESLKFNFEKKFGLIVISPSKEVLTSLLLIKPLVNLKFASLIKLNFKKLLNTSKLKNPFTSSALFFFQKTLAKISSSGISSVKLFSFFSLLFNLIKILLFNKNSNLFADIFFN